MKQYVVDAFTDHIFAGNPAAVCILDAWFSADLMLAIARENNLSETVFAVREGERYHLRWFTPGGEVDLCGHATLACAFVLFTFFHPEQTQLALISQSGALSVEKIGDTYRLDFPAYPLRPVAVTEEMIRAIGETPREAYMGRDLLCIFDDEDAVRRMRPDMDALKQLDGLLLQATAPGRQYDCVSRSFAPKLDIPEDPVCGSGHCHIIPYWAKALGKDKLTAYQASRRGGTLFCEMAGDRVRLSGNAALYSVDEVFVGEK